MQADDICNLFVRFQFSLLQLGLCAHWYKWFASWKHVLCKFSRYFFFLKKLSVLFVGSLISLFWTSGDICGGFQSQGGSSHFHALSPWCNRFTSGLTPAYPLSAKPFWSTHLYTTSIGAARVQDREYHCLTVCDKTDALWAMPVLPSDLFLFLYNSLHPTLHS